MSQILVRNLSPETVERLKKRAKINNRSLEAEVREILSDAADDNSSPEYRAFFREILEGRDRKLAFIDYTDKVQAKRPVDPKNSADLIRREREERDARVK